MNAALVNKLKIAGIVVAVIVGIVLYKKYHDENNSEEE